jgi:hypothetical protein
MTFKQALSRLRGRDDWDIVLDYLLAERESAIGDFQSADHLDNPAKLARLSGEISALDRIYQTLKDEPVRPSQETI